MKKFILSITVIVMIISCGSRKSEVRVAFHKRDFGITQQGNYNIEGSLLKNVQYSTFDDGFTLSPVNPDEPMEYTDTAGKKTTVKNGVLEKRSKKENFIHDEKQIQKESGNYSAEITASEEGKTKTKATERKDGVALAVAILVVLGVIMIIIFIYKKRNEKDIKDFPA